jgi:hypothetical protein
MPDSTFNASPGFDLAATAAEGQRQAAQAASTRVNFGEVGPAVDADKGARQKQADINYFKAMLASAVQNGTSTSAALSALLELGIRP